MSEPSPGISTQSEASVAPAGLRVRIFGRTDVGKVREHNEDNFIIADLTQNLRNVRPEVREHEIGPRGTLFAVCDGMGGAAAGEVASQMAVDTIHELVQGGAPPRNRDQFALRLSAAVQEAGTRIYLAAKANRAQRGMGTTSTVAGVFDRTLVVGQVGDSRAYMLRKGRFKQLTKDQSLVWKLIESGQLTEAEAETYEHAHIILQALGTSDSVTVDLSFVELRKGDCVMVCSDGLSGLVSNDDMREILMTNESPMDACKKLTDAALAGGGHDNITVIVARFDGDVPAPGLGDDAFGYQAYVAAEPLDVDAGMAASGSVKAPDAPPPGKDVKNMVSMRPPPMSVPPAPFSMQPTVRTEPIRSVDAGTSSDDLRLPLHTVPRSTVIAVVAAVVVLAIAAGVMLLRGGGSHSPRGAAVSAPRA